MKKMMRRGLALLLTLIMVIGMAPNITLSAEAAGAAGLTVVDKINDPETLNNWRDYYGANALMPDGTRGISTWKAGGVWTDKSVFASNQALTAANLPVSLVDSNDFVVSLSASSLISAILSLISFSNICFSHSCCSFEFILCS